MLFICSEEINFHRSCHHSRDEMRIQDEIKFATFIDVYLSFVRNAQKLFFLSLPSIRVNSWKMLRQTIYRKELFFFFSLSCACFGINNFKLSVFTQLLFAEENNKSEKRLIIEHDKRDGKRRRRVLKFNRKTFLRNIIFVGNFVFVVFFSLERKKNASPLAIFPTQSLFFLRHAW